MTLIPVEWRKRKRGHYNPEEKVFYRDVDADHFMRLYDGLGMNSEFITLLESMGCVLTRNRFVGNKDYPPGTYEIELAAFRVFGKRADERYTEGPQYFLSLRRFRKVQ